MFPVLLMILMRRTNRSLTLTCIALNVRILSFVVPPLDIITVLRIANVHLYGVYASVIFKFLLLNIESQQCTNTIICCLTLRHHPRLFRVSAIMTADIQTFGFPPGYFVVRSVATGRLLDVTEDEIEDSTEIILWPEKETSLVESV